MNMFIMNNRPYSILWYTQEKCSFSTLLQPEIKKKIQPLFDLWIFEWKTKKNVLFSASSHFLKVELPDYIDIDHEPESIQTKQNISMTDQSSEQDKSLTKYKQIEDDNEIDIIYQDSESEQRDTSEIGELIQNWDREASNLYKFCVKLTKKKFLMFFHNRTAVYNTGVNRKWTCDTWRSTRYVQFWIAWLGRYKAIDKKNIS